MGKMREICGRLAESGERVRVTIDGEKIQKVESVPGNPSPSDKSAEPDEVWIAPGLIDLQINGFAGNDLNLTGASPEERAVAVRNLTRKVLESGVTSFCPTVITASYEEIHAGMKAIRLACENDPLVDRAVAGIHLEGPYLSEEDGPRGAHPREYIKDPDWREFVSWQEAAGGRIRIVTLAPERAGALEMIKRLAEAGIVVCIGHTGASHEEIVRAAEAGAKMSTHLGNGAHPLLPRHPNYIWSQLAEDRLAASIIADGHHLHPSVVKVMARVKQGRLVLVSDAVHLAGMKPGIYKTHVGGEVELLPSGRLQIVTNPLILAGSASSLTDCVGRFARFAECSLAQAIAPATRAPARIANIERTAAGRGKGSLLCRSFAVHMGPRSMPNRRPSGNQTGRDGL